MMLAAGKHRLEVKEAKPKERRRLARAERVLARYQELHGRPLSHTTPAMVLDLARKVAHHRAMLNDPKYAYWFKTGTVHTDHLPAPVPDPPKPKPKRLRPSDGRPSGSPFDYEEYETRLADRKAADPEKVQREKAAKRGERNAFWFRYTEASQFDKANEELKEILVGRNRLRDIWGAIWAADQAEKIDRVQLRQEDRIANARNRGRVRGVGRAARLAGF